MIRTIRCMWGQVPMLPLKHSWLFDYDPYGDMFDAIIIPTAGVAIATVVLLLDPLPVIDMPVLIPCMLIPVGLGSSAAPGNFGRINKLKAFGFFLLVFSCSIYGSTLFSNSPGYFILWVCCLTFLAYLPLVRLPKFIAFSGLAVGVSIEVAKTGGGGSFYIANERLLTFMYLCMIAGACIVFYPQYLGYKKRVALWHCMEALEQSISDSATARTRALKQYSQHMQRYKKYYQINYKDKELHSVAEELLQCFMSVIYIINHPALLEALQQDKQNLLPSIQNIIKACGQGTVISLPAFQPASRYEITSLQNNIYNLSVATNNFLESPTRES